MPSKKIWIEIILMPTVVALVGIVGTAIITNVQEKNAQIKAAADRQIKLLEVFSEKVTSKDESERILALRLLKAMDADLASKLASAVAETEPEGSKVKRAADEANAEATARARLLPRVYLHIQSNDYRSGAQKISSSLEKEDIVVPGIERVGAKAPQVTQIRYFRKAEKDEAQRIASVLESLGVQVTLQYIGGYEDSKAISPMHFEIWFAPGQPRLAGTT